MFYLIPARGGSKGVPGKNIRNLGGIPLIAHTIRAALAVADNPEEVVVSTDSEEIADVARSYGASVPFMRPAELATDTAGSREVILHAADALLEPGEPVVLLQPTSPFRNPQDIRKAVELFEKERPDMVVSVRPAATNPYYNAYECDETGCLRISKGDGLLSRRQDAPAVWEFDGSIYVIDPEALRKVPSLARLQRILPIENTVATPVDIDTELDFRLANLLISSRE